MPDKVFFQKSEANENASWILILLLLIVVLGIQILDPFNIDLCGFASLVYATTALGIASLFYSRVRQRPNFVAMFTGLIQVLFFTAFGSFLSYMLARYSASLWDAQLEKWDAALGFNWIQAAFLLDANPWAIMPLHWAYGSLIPQVIILILTLGFSSHLTELRRLNFAIILSGTIIILVFPFFGAVSNYVHHGISASNFVNFKPWMGPKPIEDFLAVRERTLTNLNLFEMEGIITFPSYHAGLAVVTCWGFWVSRFWLLRLGGCSVAFLTIIATPIDGGHYLVDVISGCLIGAFAVVLSKLAVRLTMS